MNGGQRFFLAPMDPMVRGLTIFLFLLPVLFLVLPIFDPQLLIMRWVGLGIAALYLVVWVWFRPTAFRLTDTEVVLEFPIRRILVSRDSIVEAEVFDGNHFKEHFGAAIRVGIGGLWGGFGLLWTSKGGWLDFFVSRSDGFLLLHRRGGRPLLITPEQPQKLRDLLSSSTTPDSPEDAS